MDKATIVDRADDGLLRAALPPTKGRALLCCPLFLVGLAVTSRVAFLPIKNQG